MKKPRVKSKSQSGKRKPGTDKPKWLLASLAAKAKKKPVAAKAPAKPRSRKKLPAAIQKGQATSQSDVPVKGFSPYIEPTRWPRDISLAKVVKRKEMGDVTGLAKSIDDRGGLLQPIVIIEQGGKDYLIAGQRRLAAWALSDKFRKQPIPVHVMPSIDSILKGEWDENAQRKDFTPSESVELVDALLPEAQAAAQARMRKGKKADDSEAGEAMEHLASYLGRDRKTLTRAKEVVEAAAADPEKYGSLLAAMDKSGKVNGPWKRLQIHRQVADIKEKKANGKLDVPAGKFDRMVADVPWPHEPDDPAPDERGRATRPYPPMSIDAIKALPVKSRIAKNCVCYFWTTNFHMEFAYQILRAWGFDKFPTILTWTKNVAGRGQRLRSITEHAIIAIKGNPVWNLTDQTTELRADVREDSRKPDEFYALIDELTPAQRSLELFARRELPESWEGFGDQVGKFKDEPQLDPATNDGLHGILDGIAKGVAVAFDAAHEALSGLIKGKRKVGLTAAGRGLLAQLSDAKAEREEAALTAEQKAERDRDRLKARALKLGHEVVITIEGDDDFRERVLGCSCGWSGRLPERDDVEVRSATAIDEHYREAVASAPERDRKPPTRPRSVAAAGRGERPSCHSMSSGSPVAEAAE